MKDITKDSIIQAPIFLISQKSYEKITITDITKKAGVSRMSFYRNYKKIDDVLIDAVDKLFNDFQTELDECRGMDLKCFAEKYFEKLKENRNLIEVVKKSSCYEKLFDIVFKYNRIMMEKQLGRNELTPEEIMILYYHSGGMYELIKFCSDIDFSIPVSKIMETLNKAYPYAED